MINKVTIVGRVGTEPEVKAVGASTLCKITVATKESWKDKQDQWQEKTEWHNIVMWGKLAEVQGKTLGKGSLVYVEGKNATRSWEAQDGSKRYATEIIANHVKSLVKSGHEPKEMQPRNDFKKSEPKESKPPWAMDVDTGEIPF